jgi:hypothetical protein
VCLRYYPGAPLALKFISFHIKDKEKVRERQLAQVINSTDTLLRRADVYSKHRLEL